jgi:hypothetical protein
VILDNIEDRVFDQKKKVHNTLILPNLDTILFFDNLNRSKGAIMRIIRLFSTFFFVHIRFINKVQKLI